MDNYVDQTEFILDCVEFAGKVADEKSPVSLLDIFSSQFSAAVSQRKIAMFDDINTISKIGVGSFGKVYKIKLSLFEESFALKRIIKADERTVKCSFNELNALRRCLSPHIVKLFAAFQTENYANFILEYCSYGNLDDFTKTALIPKEAASVYFVEIGEAIQHLHSLGIVHRDLKPSNILLDQNLHLKVSDLGCAKFLKRGEVCKEVDVGTWQYHAPESAIDNYWRFESDNWAYGAVMFEMFHPQHHLLIDVDGRDEYKTFIVNPRNISGRLECISQIEKVVLKKILTKLPTCRLTLEAALNENYIWERFGFKKSNIREVDLGKFFRVGDVQESNQEHLDHPLRLSIMPNINSYPEKCLPFFGFRYAGENKLETTEIERSEKPVSLEDMSSLREELTSVKCELGKTNSLYIHEKKINKKSSRTIKDLEVARVKLEKEVLKYGQDVVTMKNRSEEDKQLIETLKKKMAELKISVVSKSNEIGQLENENKTLLVKFKKVNSEMMKCNQTKKLEEKKHLALNDDIRSKKVKYEQDIKKASTEIEKLLAENKKLNGKNKDLQKYKIQNEELRQIINKKKDELKILGTSNDDFLSTVNNLRKQLSESNMDNQFKAKQQHTLEMDAVTAKCQDELNVLKISLENSKIENINLKKKNKDLAEKQAIVSLQNPLPNVSEEEPCCSRDVKELKCVAVKRGEHDGLGCPFCTKSFIHRKSLQRHIENKHKRVKKPVCSFCGKTFANKDTLRVHSYTHKKIKPYKCKFCDERFDHTGKKAYHVKIKHTAV